MWVLGYWRRYSWSWTQQPLWSNLFMPSCGRNTFSPPATSSSTLRLVTDTRHQYQVPGRLFNLLSTKGQHPRSRLHVDSEWPGQLAEQFPGVVPRTPVRLRSLPWGCVVQPPGASQQVARRVGQRTDGPHDAGWQCLQDHSLVFTIVTFYWDKT